MIKFFRHIRRSLIQKNQMGKYFKYAIGEIILVVIGILIALQINNWNEGRKARNLEVSYLKNIKTDLQLNIDNINTFIEKRNDQIASSNLILEYYEGKSIEDLNNFSYHCVNVYTWKKFYQINNTYLELTNSGNLALITNDSIKNTLLNLDALYKELKGEEEHFRFDSEELLYKPSFAILDLNPITQSYMYDTTNGKMGTPVELSKAEFDELLENLNHKNGFVMAVYEFTVMNGQLSQMKTMSEQLISMIDREIQTNY